MINGTFTRKALKEGLTLYCGYCDIQRVTSYLPEIGYNTGVYGWNCTVYAAGDVLVVTGYRPAGRGIDIGVLRLPRIKKYPAVLCNMHKQFVHFTNFILVLFLYVFSIDNALYIMYN